MGGARSRCPGHAVVSRYVDSTAWARGPQAVYDRLAAAAFERVGIASRLPGAQALDAGAGTGAATRLLLCAGATVTAVDISPFMLAELRRQTDCRAAAVVGDIAAIPLRPASYDVAIACFVLNHLSNPATGLSELVRVTRPAGLVLVTTFSQQDHPLKTAVDDTLMRYGYRLPDWYLSLKQTCAPLTADREVLADLGYRSGLTELAADDVDVPLGDLGAGALADYRLGMPHVAPFVRELDRGLAAQLRADAVAAVRRVPDEPLRQLVLWGRPGPSSSQLPSD